MRYVVEIAEDAKTDKEKLLKLIEVFEFSEAKAKKLLNRTPGIVTKPLSFEEAEFIAGRFRKAGFRKVATHKEEPLVATWDSPDTWDSQFAAASQVAQEEIRLPQRFFTELEPVSEPAPEPTEELNQPPETMPTLRFRRRLLSALLALLSLFVLSLGLASLIRPLLSEQTLHSRGYIDVITTSLEEISSATPQNTVTLRLQHTLDQLKAALRSQNVQLLIVADLEGRPLAGWYQDLAIEALPEAILSTTKTYAQSALAQAYAREVEVALGNFVAENSMVKLPFETLLLSAQVGRFGSLDGVVILGQVDRTQVRASRLLGLSVLMAMVTTVMAMLAGFVLARGR
jgi:hypothetical protein